MKLTADDIGRHVFLALGGCVLAVVSMGVYSLLLFASTGVFLLQVCSLSPAHVHPWVFGVQMSWQTLWHLYMQYREYYLNETTNIRYVSYRRCYIRLEISIFWIVLDKFPIVHCNTCFIRPIGQYKSIIEVTNDWIVQLNL